MGGGGSNAGDPRRAGSEFAVHWGLDPEVLFLNHGSFGACPVPVLREQERLRRQLEAEPVRFLHRESEARYDEARRALAAFLGADPAGLAFVPNVTHGVNTVLRAVTLGAGDELLVTDHEYAACRNVLEVAAARTGARVVVARLPFPVTSDEQIVAAVTAAATPRTRLALIDHVTSPTALVLPAARIVRELAARGIDTLVDGAHAPGMIPVEIDAIGAAWYTGNCHKWLCAPKGAGFLWARQDRRDRLQPLAVSHGARSVRTDRPRYRLEFDWTGTHDPTPFLCLPEAIRFLGALLPGGWPELMARNAALARDARRRLAARLDLPPPCPEEMLGSMASLRLPDSRHPLHPVWITDELQNELYRRHRIETVVAPWPAHPSRWLRVSAAAYNRIEQFELLAEAVGALLAEY